MTRLRDVHIFWCIRSQRGLDWIIEALKRIDGWLRFYGADDDSAYAGMREMGSPEPFSSAKIARRDGVANVVGGIFDSLTDWLVGDSEGAFEFQGEHAWVHGMDSPRSFRIIVPLTSCGVGWGVSTRKEESDMNEFIDNC
jgi:hypothetical protein